VYFGTRAFTFDVTVGDKIKTMYGFDLGVYLAALAIFSQYFV
jgi:hypothetical protein